MVIVSQDRKFALNSDCVCWYEKGRERKLDTHYKDYWCQIIAVVNNDCQFRHILGWYRTEEEADEVFNHLLTALEDEQKTYWMKVAK